MDLGPRGAGGSMVVGEECKRREGLRTLHVPWNIPATHSRTVAKVRCIASPVCCGAVVAMVVV